MSDSGTVLERISAGDRPLLTLRHVAPGDAPALLSYINALSAERTFIVMQGVQLTLAQEQAWLDDRLAESTAGNGITLTVVDDDAAVDGRIVGVAGVARGGPLQGHVGVLGISLASAVRGRGIGSQLLGATLREAEHHLPGLRLVQLDVFGSNDVARRLYRRHGFIEYARLPGGIRHGDDWVDLVSMYRPVDRPNTASD